MNRRIPHQSRLAVVSLAVLAATAAGWSDPSPAANFTTLEPEVQSTAGLPGMPPPPQVPAASKAVPAAAAPSVLPSQAATSQPSPMPETTSQSPLAVVGWGFGPTLGTSGAAAAGRPLYLRITLDGGQQAVDRMRAGPIPIDVHWTRDGGGPGAPDLVTRLTVGGPGLAPIFAGQVRHEGRFEWHSWARKDTLSPGQWTVSLTYPDGRPLSCGQTEAAPCRFLVNVG